MLKKLWPKEASQIPSAKRNHKGKVVSSPTEIKNVLSKEYKDRLRERPFRPDIVDVIKYDEIIFQSKMKYANSNISSMFTMQELDTV